MNYIWSYPVTSCTSCDAEWEHFPSTSGCADPRCAEYSRSFSELMLRFIFKQRAVVVARGRYLSPLELPRPWRFAGHPTPESIQVSAPTEDMHKDEDIVICF